jgi:hypothetical protein
MLNARILLAFNNFLVNVIQTIPRLFQTPNVQGTFRRMYLQAWLFRLQTSASDDVTNVIVEDP